jgi:hypothetical protein
MEKPTFKGHEDENFDHQGNTKSPTYHSMSGTELTEIAKKQYSGHREIRNDGIDEDIKHERMTSECLLSKIDHDDGGYMYNMALQACYDILGQLQKEYMKHEIETLTEDHLTEGAWRALGLAKKKICEWNKIGKLKLERKETTL